MIFSSKGIDKSVNSDGNIYFNQFKHGISNGIVSFKTKNRNKFEGYWVDNKLDGLSIINIEKREQLYSGELKKVSFNGIGKFNSKNNILYKGKFNEGKIERKGYLIYKNKKEYKSQL